MGGYLERKRKKKIEKPGGLIFACSKVTPPPLPKKALKEWHGNSNLLQTERFIKVYSIILNTSVL